MFIPYQPIKRKNGKAVLGFFYRRKGATVQYITFRATIASIAAGKVVPATEEEYRQDRARRYAQVAQRIALSS